MDELGALEFTDNAQKFRAALKIYEKLCEDKKNKLTVNDLFAKFDEYFGRAKMGAFASALLFEKGPLGGRVDLSLRGLADVSNYMLSLSKRQKISNAPSKDLAEGTNKLAKWTLPTANFFDSISNKFNPKSNKFGYMPQYYVFPAHGGAPHKVSGAYTWSNEMYRFIKEKYEKNDRNWKAVTDLFSFEFLTFKGYKELQAEMKKYIPSLGLDYDKWSLGIYDLYPFLDSQLKEYFKTGERLYKLEEISALVHLDPYTTIPKYTRKYLEEELHFSDRAELIYQMVFGRNKRSYHQLKDEVSRAGFKLEVTPSEWLDIVEDYLENKDKYRDANDIRIRVKCEKNGHVSVKTIMDIRKGTGCRACVDDIMIITYNDAIDLGMSRGLDLISDEAEFDEELKKAKLRGRRANSILLSWRHRKCGYVFERTYRNVMQTKGACPVCDSKNINQMITLRISNYAFADYLRGRNFRSEVKLIDLFDHLDRKDASIKRMRVDIFQRLVIDGKIIYLAIEYDGRQHDKSKEIGFKAYKGITRNKGTERDWLASLARDALKDELFKSKNNEGYYLIRVPYTIAPNQRQEFIVQELENQLQNEYPGIKLRRRPLISWRQL